MNNHLINGLAGATQATLVTIVGYPFDLVKARLQIQTHATSWGCFRHALAQEGVVGLYRGEYMPWLSHLIKRPLQFTLA